MITCPSCNADITSSYFDQLNDEIVKRLENLIRITSPQTATAELKLAETSYGKLDHVLDIMRRMIIYIGHRTDCESLPLMNPTRCNCGFHELKRDINAARSS